MKAAFALASAALLAAWQPGAQEPADAPASPPAATAPTTQQTFRFGNHVPEAVITAVTGADTATARMVGHVPAATNYAYCMDMRGPDGAADCAAENVDQPDEEMTADCIAKTVSDGSSAAWVRDEDAGDGKVLPVWQDKETGQMRDYSGAGGGYVLTAAFRILCPAASTSIAADPM